MESSLVYPRFVGIIALCELRQFAETEGHFPGQLRPTGLRGLKGILAEPMSGVSEWIHAWSADKEFC